MDAENLARVNMALSELRRATAWLEETLSPSLTDLEIHNRVSLAFHATDAVIGILRDVEIQTIPASTAPKFPKHKDA
jgi:hypothetical protein